MHYALCIMNYLLSLHDFYVITYIFIKVSEVKKEVIKGS